MENTAMIGFLEETINIASNELTKRFGSKLDIKRKTDSSLVTEADLASEKVIIDRIKKYYPEDSIFSEEAGQSEKTRRPGGRIWVIDPLDGTTNFSNNYPFFCVSIACGQIKSDSTIEVIAGAIKDPIFNKTYLAAKGHGATCNHRAISVANPRPFKESFLCTGFYYHRGEKLVEDIARFSKIAQLCQSIRRDGAAALDLALVAEGVFDGFWESGLQPWDVAAGSLLISEAGGKIKNYKNREFNIEIDDVIAGSSGIVDSIDELI